jgi:hypothetical protein
MSQRLSDEAVADIREKVAAGAPKAVIAAAYCSSVRHLNRIVAGESRLPLSEPVEDGAALAAVEEFFRALTSPLRIVLAESLRTLAAKLDQVRGSDAATAAAAAPALRQLAETVDGIERRRVDREPSPSESILARRAWRRRGFAGEGRSVQPGG